MPSWNELTDSFAAVAKEARSGWMNDRLKENLARISSLRGDSNVVYYSSAFLQKPTASPYLLQVTHEDINGFMSVIKGMNWAKPLTLMLHTPGGVTAAAQTIVDYLRSKFPAGIEVIVPVFAMSAGTMIALGSDRILMGRQSQLGPIDPQFSIGGRMVSAQAIVDQFGLAVDQITGPGGDLQRAHVWAPILQSLGPDLLIQARYALDYGEHMVSEWLREHMLKGEPDPKAKATEVVKHFNDAGLHKNHARRIDRQEARTTGVTIEDLEQNQDLQDAVLTAYHLSTIAYGHSPCVKMITSPSGQSWVKNWHQN